MLSRTGQHASMKTWAFAVPLSGPARRLDYGPAGDVAVLDGAVLVGSAMNIEPREPADWKRYRGGSGGKIWYSPDGSRYTRILADVGGNLVNPMFVGSRVAFLSDHEGTGALYSALPDGGDLRRHTDLGEYYARNATTDGQRVVYQRAGEIWLLESLDAKPVRLDIRLSGDRQGRAPYPVLGEVGAWLVHAGCHRPGARRRSPRPHALAADRERRPGPDDARRARRARPPSRGHPRRRRGRLRVRQRRRGRRGRDSCRWLGGAANRTRRVRQDPRAGGGAGRAHGSGLPAPTAGC